MNIKEQQNPNTKRGLGRRVPHFSFSLLHCVCSFVFHEAVKIIYWRSESNSARDAGAFYRVAKNSRTSTLDWASKRVRPHYNGGSCSNVVTAVFRGAAALKGTMLSFKEGRSLSDGTHLSKSERNSILRTERSVAGPRKRAFIWQRNVAKIKNKSLSESDIWPCNADWQYRVLKENKSTLLKKVAFEHIDVFIWTFYHVIPLVYCLELARVFN